MTPEVIRDWTKNQPLSPIEVDCATAVMLKILDGKCKMAPDEQEVMRALYGQVKHLPGELLGTEVHDLIAAAEDRLDAGLKQAIHEKRLLAESLIPKPVMKAFKAKVRGAGLLGGNDAERSAVSARERTSMQ